jgi:hypothetical protein
MLSTAIETLLTLIESLLPSLGIASSNVVSKIIVALIQIVPILAEEATNLITPVKNIIAALQSHGALTPDQLAQLQALDTQCDAAFDAALAKISAEPPASA